MGTYLTGMAEMNRNIEALKGSLRAPVVEAILLTGARRIASAARANAPKASRGHWRKRKWIEPGNLKKSIIAKTLERRGLDPAPAIAAIDYRKGPHAHLVEFGTSERIGKTGKSSGRMPAHPFFRPAWDANHNLVEEQIRTDLAKALDGAI